MCKTGVAAAHTDCDCSQLKRHAVNVVAQMALGFRRKTQKCYTDPFALSLECTTILQIRLHICLHLGAQRKNDLMSRY